MRTAFAILAVVAIATTSQAAVMIQGNLAPEMTVDGFDIYTLTAVSDEGDISAFDFEGDNAVDDDLGIWGPLNQINPFGTPSIFSNNNNILEGTGNNPLLDSQFLFNGTGQTSVTIPDGFSRESASMLAATFAAAGPIGSTVPFARVVMPEGGVGTFSGIVVVGSNFTEVPVSGIIGVPEPATASLLGLSLAGVFGFRRRR